MGKKHLKQAQKTKNDEFYTQYADVEQGCQFYNAQLRGKTVLCNCDNHETSNFVKYFKNNFKTIGLKTLISTTKHELYVYDGITETVGSLESGGYGAIDILNLADVVITNPPFSVFRDFYKIVKNKKFLVIAPLLSISYVDIYNDFLEGKVKIAHKKTQMKFVQPDGTIKGVPILWLTNLDTPYPQPLKLKTKYDPAIHQKYDDFNGFINVRKVKEIPCDYNEWMGIPITFLVHYNPEQFELSDKYLIQHDLHINAKNIFLRAFARVR